MADHVESRVRWLLVSWLFVLSAVAYLDRINLSIAGSFIATEFRLTNVQLGSLTSAFLMGYALFQTVGGWLADRLGSRRVLAAGVLWWGVFTSLTAAVPPAIVSAVLVLATTRFLLGAGEAVLFPASNQFVSRWIPSEAFLITYIMVHYSWRWSFWMSAIIGLAAGIVWYVIARNTPEEHNRVSPAELRHIQAGRTVGRSASSGAAKESSPSITAADDRILWSTILSSKNVWAVTLAYFCFGYVAWIFFTWFFIYLATVRGLNLKASASYTTLLFLSMAACSPLGGAISDKLTKLHGKRIGRCGIAVFALLLTAVFLTFGSQVQSAGLASIVLAGGAGALYLSQSSFWSLTADIASGSSGSVSGFMNMGNQFGGALTASLTPAIAARFGWTTSFFVAAGLSVLGAAAWLLVDPQRALAPETRPSPSL